jgi:predicted exporter
VTPSARFKLAAWGAGLLVCLVITVRTQFSTDLSAFLPRSPSPAQQVLVEQLRDGVVSRLILIGLEGGDPQALARISKRIAASLRASDAFTSVNNGEPGNLERDREFLWRNRYLLSPAVEPKRFSAPSLRASLEEGLGQLASPAGALLGRTLPADPTGELLRVLEDFTPQKPPGLVDGVWFSADGRRALVVAQTRAAGSNVDAQERALKLIHAAVKDARAGAEVQLLATGPGVFSVAARQRIRNDTWRVSIIATALVAALLLALYRSVRVFGLGLLPVASGALAGVAAVSVAFGWVHGITLAFGVTLIGEGVDYTIYLFTQNPPGVAPRTAFERLWPTLRLGVLTSICGFSAMLFSDFTALAQLGLFSVTGLVVAALVTRFVLPELLPAGFALSAVSAFEPRVLALVRAAPGLRTPMLLGLAAALAFLLMRPPPLWGGTLASLSPVSAEEQALDQELRRDLGAPDVRYLVVVRTPDEQATLQAAERVGTALRTAIARGWLQNFDSPAAYLPSRATQLARQEALPPADTLRGNLQAALTKLPFRADAFEPFLRDAAAAKTLPPLERASLQGTTLALRLDALLVERESGWSAILPLQGVSDAAGIAGALGEAHAVLLDLKNESDEMYRGYLRETLRHALLGAAAVLILLIASLRSVRRVLDVTAPLGAAVIVTCAVLLLARVELTIFHLVGLLLVVAVGSNYSLFFDGRLASDRDRGRVIVSLVFAGGSTLAGFGSLAFSGLAVLNNIGVTVALGAGMALVFSAIMSRQADTLGEHARNP